MTIETEAENPRRPERAALGMALGMRAAEIQGRVLQRIDGHADRPLAPSQAYEEHKRGRILFGTLLVAR